VFVCVFVCLFVQQTQSQGKRRRNRKRKHQEENEDEDKNGNEKEEQGEELVETNAADVSPMFPLKLFPPPVTNLYAHNARIVFLQ
jgi:hypothetical protein